MTVQVPYDLQETVRKLATEAGSSPNDFLTSILRNAIELERANYMNKTLALNCVGERKVAYRAKKKNSQG